jgi:hypothetical protein
VQLTFSSDFRLKPAMDADEKVLLGWTIISGERFAGAVSSDAPTLKPVLK